MIVVLSTCGDEADSALAREFGSVNLIIGGRSYRPNEAEPWAIGATRIVRTQRDGRSLGRMDVVWGAENQIKTFSPSLISLETSDPSDPAMLSLIRKTIPDYVDNPTDDTRHDATSAPPARAAVGQKSR